MEIQKANAVSKISFAMETLAKSKFVIVPSLQPNELEGFVSYFGTIEEQYGKRFYPVKPTTALYSANSSKALYPHTDRNEHADNEILVGLYVERQDKFDQGGYTGVCDMNPFLDSLSADELDYLTGTEVTIIANNVLKTMGADFYHGPMLKVKPDGSYSFRFSYNFTQVLQDDGRFLSFRDKVITFYNDNKMVIKMPKMSLLLFDNTVCLHDRTNIYDLDRSLFRFYVKAKN